MQSLAHLQELIESGKSHVIHTSQLSRADREWLVQRKWLEEIMRGWYLAVRPDLPSGDSTAWYASFWDFLRVYLAHHYSSDYCLSAESSIDLHLGSTVVPRQVIVLASKGSGSPQSLPFDTSLLVYADPVRLPEKRETLRGLQVMPMGYALCRVSSVFFRTSPEEAEIALRSMEASELLQVIAEHQFKSAAGRLIGAYRFLKLGKVADDLRAGLEQIGVAVSEENPFETSNPILAGGVFQSPYGIRIQAKWEQFRSVIASHFPPPPGLSKSSTLYLQQVSEVYAQDAYNSLSIEGYQVSRELIEKVKAAKWSPDMDPQDRQMRDALAARGYYEAFQAVKESVEQVLNGASPGEVAKDDLSRWYQKLFSPSVQAGVLAASDLFGYRRNQVYIRQSRHTPPPKEYLLDSMDALFQCLCEEPHAGVRAVLGHFIFVYIHPYMDGNGRLGRFLMNVMLASGGYPWTVIEVAHRSEYLKTLEVASVDGDILPFTRFVAAALSENM